MTRRATTALLLLAMIHAAEAFDVYLVGKVAPLIASSFGVETVLLTGAFVFHHLGLAAGALGGGMVADRLGKSIILQASLVLAGLSTLAVPFCASMNELILLRAVAGLFLGAAGSVVVASASLLPTQRSTSFAIPLVLAGYSIGSTAGSLFAWTLRDPNGWRGGFAFAGTALLLLSVPVRMILPEKADDPDRQTGSRGSLGFQAIAPLCLCFFLSMGLVSLLGAWLPTFFFRLADVPVQRFAGVGLLYAPAAVLGMLAVAFWARERMLVSLTAIAFGIHALALAGLGLVPFGYGFFAMMYFASVAGQASSQALLNVVVAQRLSGRSRATAFGFAGASGRIGGILTPWIGGVALDHRWPLPMVFGLAALVPATSGAILLAFILRWRHAAA